MEAWEIWTKFGELLWDRFSGTFRLEAAQAALASREIDDGGGTLEKIVLIARVAMEISRQRRKDGEGNG